MKQNGNYCLAAPICLGIITTNRCNLKCRHCMNSADLTCNVELSTSEIKKIIDDAYQYDIKYVEFNGGEFFVRNDVEELIDYALAKKLKITITTNATLITNSWMKKYIGKISLIRVSLDSHIERVHDEFRGQVGAFRKTVDTIKQLIGYGYSVTVLTTISKSRLDTFEDFLLFLESIKVRGLHTTLLVPAGRGEELANEVLTPEEHRDFLLQCRRYSKEHVNSSLRILEESPQSCLLDSETGEIIDCATCKCGAAFTEIVVLNDGYVLPCAAFVSVREMFRHDELNIKNHSIVWIYKNAQLMKDVRALNQLEGKCGSCELVEKCGGGCRIAALLSSHNIHGTDPLCWKK